VLCDQAPQPIAANSNQPTGPYKGVYTAKVSGEDFGGTFLAQIDYKEGEGFSGWCRVLYEGGIIEADTLTVTPSETAPPDEPPTSPPSSGSSEDTMATCSDGIDNDENGHTDCGDWGCSKNTDPQIAELCADSMEASVATCTDGIDNDNNGHTDCGDWSCSKNTDPQVAALCEATTEGSLASCSDGIDNDGNGYIDCKDFNCSKSSVPEVAALCAAFTEASVATCSDGIDNDENGYTDCGDFSCSKSSDPEVATLCAGTGVGPATTAFIIVFSRNSTSGPSFSLTFEVVPTAQGTLEVHQDSVELIINSTPTQAVLGKETVDEDCTCFEGTWSGSKVSGTWNFVVCGNQIVGIYEGDVGGTYTGTIQGGQATIVTTSGTPLATGKIGSTSASGQWNYMGQTGSWSGYQSCD